MNFDDKQTQKFITLVQAYPCLYNMTLTSYRNKFFRNNAWEYIAKKWTSMVSEVSLCWKNKAKVIRLQFKGAIKSESLFIL